MIKLSLKILAIIFLFIFQITFFNKLIIFGSIPNLILILSVALLLRNRFNDALLVAVVGGLLLDLVSPIYFGIYTLLFLAILFVLHFSILKVVPVLSIFWIYVIFLGAFLILDLFILLFTKTWPSWVTIANVSINGLWGILAYYILGYFLKTTEEIKIE